METLVEVATVAKNTEAVIKVDRVTVVEDMTVRDGKIIMALKVVAQAKVRACRTMVIIVEVTTKATALEMKISRTSMQTLETGLNKGSAMVIRGAQEDLMARAITLGTTIPVDTRANMSTAEKAWVTLESTRAKVSVMATILEISNPANTESSTISMVKTTETTGITNMVSLITSVLVPPSSVCTSVAIKTGSCLASGLL